jgi:hypothetical protein
VIAVIKTFQWMMDKIFPGNIGFVELKTIAVGVA